MRETALIWCVCIKCVCFFTSSCVSVWVLSFEVSVFMCISFLYVCVQAGQEGWPGAGWSGVLGTLCLVCLWDRLRYDDGVVCVCECVWQWLCPPGWAGSLSVWLIQSEWQHAVWLHRGQMTSDSPRLVCWCLSRKDDIHMYTVPKWTHGHWHPQHTHMNKCMLANTQMHTQKTGTSEHLTWCFNFSSSVFWLKIQWKIWCSSVSQRRNMTVGCSVCFHLLVSIYSTCVFL